MIFRPKQLSMTEQAQKEKQEPLELLLVYEIEVALAPLVKKLPTHPKKDKRKATSTGKKVNKI